MARKRPSRPMSGRLMLLLVTAVFGGVALASHYTGTYLGAEGETLVLQHDAQGGFRGEWRTAQGAFMLEGHVAGDAPGDGRAQAGGASLTFGIQLSADGTTLTLDFGSAGGQRVFRRQSHEATLGARTELPPSPPGPQPPAQQNPLATSDPLAGSYSDGQLTVTLEGESGQYHGQIVLGDQTFPLQAQGSAQQLTGTFQAGQNRFEFSAALQGDTLTFITGGSRYTLTRQAGSGMQTEPQPTASGSIRPGTRLSYYTASASHPGTRAGPDARGTAGEGLIEVTILYLDDQVCVGHMASYALIEGAVIPAGAQGFIGQGACAEFWTPPAALQRLEPSNDPSYRVARGPFEHQGRTYNAVTISTEHQNSRMSRAYDLDTGLLLMHTDGHGDRAWAGGGSVEPAGSSYMQLRHVRQLELPWAVGSPLPESIRTLQSLTYRGSMTMSMPGITPLATSLPFEVHAQVQQRAPHWLLLRSTTTMQGAGPMAPDVSEGVLSAGGGYFIPPGALHNLQAGQLLDQDPVTGIRSVVERVDGTHVVITRQGTAMTARETYEQQTGLMVASVVETRMDGSLQTLQLELIGRE